MDDKILKNFILISNEIKCTIEPENVINQDENIIGDFTCIICLNIVINPKICSECDILICLKCIDDWQKRNINCPHCKKKFAEGRVNRQIINTLSRFKIKCNYIGCVEEIWYENIITHFNKCNYLLKKYACVKCHKEIISNLLDEQIKTHYYECFKGCSICGKVNIEKNHNTQCSVYSSTKCNNCEVEVPRSHTHDQCINNIKSKFTEMLLLKDEEYKLKLEIIGNDNQVNMNVLLDSVIKSKEEEVQEIKTKMFKVYDKSNKVSDELKKLNILLFRNLQIFDLIKIFTPDKLKCLCKEFGIPERGDDFQLATDLKSILNNYNLS
jgi:hypothetical protein